MDAHTKAGGRTSAGATISLCDLLLAGMLFISAQRGNMFALSSSSGQKANKSLWSSCPLPINPAAMNRYLVQGRLSKKEKAQRGPSNGLDVPRHANRALATIKLFSTYSVPKSLSDRLSR